MPGNDGTLIMEGAEILFRNFAGLEGQYNAEGDRNFCVLLDEPTAEKMVRDGWNIKHLKPRDDEEVGKPYIQVSVKYRGRNGKPTRPPRMVLISSKGRVDLTEHECELLDWVDIQNADLIIRPFEWAVNGKSGIKAYLKSLFITINEDYLELKYADVPEIESGSGPLAIESGQEDVIDVESWEE